MASLSERLAKATQGKQVTGGHTMGSLRDAADRAASSAVERQMQGIQQAITDVGGRLGEAIARMETIQRQADTLGDELHMLRVRVTAHETAVQTDLETVKARTDILAESAEAVKDDVAVLAEIVTSDPRP